MMQGYSIFTRRAHFSQRTREMGHPQLFVMSGKWAPAPSHRFLQRPTSRLVRASALIPRLGSIGE